MALSNTHKDIYQEITDKLIAEMEKGIIPWVKPWKSNELPFKGWMPSNAITGRPYHGINVLILWATAQNHGYDDPRWLTYEQAKKAGGFVKKGERATMVVLWKPYTKTVKDSNGEEHEEDFLFARPFWVFNIAQCQNLDGLDETFEEGPTDCRNAGLTKTIERFGVDLRHGGNRAFYALDGDFVQMPNFTEFAEEDAYWATLFHECVHWTGHKSRLDRVFGKRFGDNAYATEELTAELGAAFLCATNGVALTEARHASYLGTWMKAMKADKRVIFAAASAATKAAEYLNEFSGIGVAEEDKAA